MHLGPATSSEWVPEKPPVREGVKFTRTPPPPGKDLGGKIFFRENPGSKRFSKKIMTRTFSEKKYGAKTFFQEIMVGQRLFLKKKYVRAGTSLEVKMTGQRFF